MTATPYQTKELKFDSKASDPTTEHIYKMMEDRLSKAEEIMDEARRRRSTDREFAQQLKAINDLFKK